MSVHEEPARAAVDPGPFSAAACAIGLGACVLLGAACAAPRHGPLRAPAAIPLCRQPTGLLWEVTAPDRSPPLRLFLFGSLHVATPGMFPLAPAVEDAFHRAQGLAVEVDLLAVQQSPAAGAALQSLPPGVRLSARVDPATYARVQSFLEAHRLPPTAFDTLQPWAAAFAVYRSQLAAFGYDPNEGVDLYFLRHAGEKRIVELEGLQAQQHALNGLSAQEQDALLRDALDETPETADGLRNLVEAWCDGSASRVEQALAQTPSPQVTRRLVQDRNAALTRGLARLAEAGGDWFAAIGAAHVVGPDSVVAQLQARGFSARRVGVAGELR